MAGLGHVHVIGAGVAGLACALRLASRGRPVTVHEAAGHGGGRCRSFLDSRLGCRIDNGNHLLLSGNTAVRAYLEEAGAGDGLVGPERAEFPFLDLADDVRWTVRPGSGRIPWWILSATRRIPGTRIRDYLAGWRFARAGTEAVVTDCVDSRTMLFRRFWEPLAVGVLNAPPDQAAAAPLWPVLRETFGRGEAACRPRVARHGLSETFVDPALNRLHALGATVTLSHRLRALDHEDDRVSGLRFEDRTIALAATDSVVLAVPALVAAGLVPGLETPRGHRAIVNVHFRLSRPPGGPALVGLVGGISEWVFVRGQVVSVTISAADHLADDPTPLLAAQVWPEVARALNLPSTETPPFRVVKERRATFSQTPAEVARRPSPRTAWRNLRLAGDWTATGLPATIEGAIRSGHVAAETLG